MLYVLEKKKKLKNSCVAPCSFPKFLLYKYTYMYKLNNRLDIKSDGR